MKNRKVPSIILVVLFTLALFSGCAKEPQEEITAQLTPVEAYNVAKGSIQLSYSAAGQIKPLKEVAVTPKIPGKVESVLKELGDTVNKGEVLFTLEKTDLYQKIEQLDAQLRQQLIQSEAAFKRAELQYSNAKTDYEKNKALFESDAISKQILDGYEQGLELAEVQYASARDNYLLLQNKVAVKLAEGSTNQGEAVQTEAVKSVIETQKDAVLQSIQDSEVKAPISGFVAYKNLETGQMVSQQMPAYTLVDINSVIVETDVTERMINKIVKGQEVVVTVKALGDKQFKGIIDALSPAVTGQKVGYPVKIVIDNMGHELKPGMFAEIQFITDKKDDVFLVPLEAVMTNTDDSYVYVLEEDIIKKRVVKTGFKDEKNYEIVSGLNAGDRVVVKGQQFVVDGEQVQLVGGVQ
ncbi:MAG: efflux RND transporter periplasmic adaptor subunit [Firmicutes bacterium]|nr:efflux RND transporter periplasmic adaptor subunit [Bacillota bacterium]